MVFSHLSENARLDGTHRKPGANACENRPNIEARHRPHGRTLISNALPARTIISSASVMTASPSCMARRCGNCFPSLLTVAAVAAAAAGQSEISLSRSLPHFNVKPRGQHSPGDLLRVVAPALSGGEEALEVLWRNLRRELHAHGGGFHPITAQCQQHAIVGHRADVIAAALNLVIRDRACARRNGRGSPSSPPGLPAHGRD